MNHSEAAASTFGRNADIELRRQDGLQVLFEGVACDMHHTCQEGLRLFCLLKFSAYNQQASRNAVDMRT